MVCVIGSDPHFESLWTARAACEDTASNDSTETERITEFTYDFEGRLSQVNSPEGYINYEYSLATGRLTQTCTTNSSVSYEYDSLGRLWKVNVLKRNGTTLDTPETTTYTYTAVGSRETVRLPNNTVTAYAYDHLNRLTNLTHTATNNVLLASYSYQLHPTGRRTNATEVLLNTDDSTYITNTHAWAYDAMYRLTNEVSTSTSSPLAHSTAYEYDKAGNRWKKTEVVGGTTTVITNQYNANDQLLKEVTLVSGTPTATNNYVYDANGSLTARTNITSGGTATALYAYDLKNKMNAVTTGGTTTKFLYNDQGIRVRSTVVGGSTQYFLVDANNHTGYAQVLEELSAVGGSPTMSYVIADDVLGQSTASTVSWLLYDGHGSTRHLLKGNADTTAQYNFDAYGQSLTTLPTNPEASTSLLYCGEQFDSTLGMYNLRARFYDPSNGRFNAMDSFMGNDEDPQSLHKYAYCHSDVVNRIDPSGHFTLTEVMVAVCIGLVIIAAILVNQFAKPGVLPWNVLRANTGHVIATDIAIAQTEANEVARPRTKAETKERIKEKTKNDGDASFIFLHGTSSGAFTSYQNPIINWTQGKGVFGAGFYTVPTTSPLSLLQAASYAYERERQFGGFGLILIFSIKVEDYLTLKGKFMTPDPLRPNAIYFGFDYVEGPLGLGIQVKWQPGRGAGLLGFKGFVPLPTDIDWQNDKTSIL